MLDNDTSLKFFGQFRLKALSQYVIDAACFSTWINPYQGTFVDHLLPKVREHNRRHCPRKEEEPVWTKRHAYLHGMFCDLPDELPMDVIGEFRFDTVYSPSLAPAARWPDRSWDQPGTLSQWASTSGTLYWGLPGTSCHPKSTKSSRCQELPDTPWCWATKGLRGGELVQDRAIRFTLCDRECFVQLITPWSKQFEYSWLSQSSRVIDVFKADQMIGNYFIPICANFKLISMPRSHYCHGGGGIKSSHSRAIDLDRDHLFAFTPHSRMKYSVLAESSTEKAPPIYLFLYPPPKSISEIVSSIEGHTRTHFWSFDENGQSEMSDEVCERWEVPQLTFSVEPYSRLQSWPKQAYTALHEWQIAQGFDPTTADFARHLGLPELEIIGTKTASKNRFEEATEDQASSSSNTATVADSNSTASRSETHNVVKPVVECGEADAIAAKVEDTDEHHQAALTDVNTNTPGSQITSVVRDAPDETGTDNHTTETKDTGDQEPKETNSKSWWSWEAIAGSGISAFAI
ncbi:hypothetical protein VNI00_018685 [Paramarasmius palmivorus]|uniref:Uncharacterized protein n=1 Tax=Paramarasmius palmivorus TaxID=297713 RepID=A0AAW0AWD5_9AGAR